MLMLCWLTKQRKIFKACGGLFVRCLLCCDEEEGSARDILLSPALPTSARMSPHQVIPRQVASLQSPLPFHLVSLFRWLSGSFLHTLAYNGKRYWPSSCKMSPCCEASVMASCAVRLEHFERCMISSRSWL